MLNRVLLQQPRHLLVLCLTCGFLLAGVCGGASAAIFCDVSESHPQFLEIEALARQKITDGCLTNPLKYCPGDSITRAEMAAFVCSAEGKTWYNSSVQHFNDVPRGTNGQWDGGGTGDLDADGTHRYYGWVERLARSDDWSCEVPTAGCGSGNFCPNGSVKRKEAAVWLVRARCAPNVPTWAPTFADVPSANNPYYTYVEKFANPQNWQNNPPHDGLRRRELLPGGHRLARCRCRLPRPGLRPARSHPAGGYQAGDAG